jgi:hypothetical protein
LARALAALLSGCVEPEASREALEAAGYSDIEITGWKPFNCGEDDTFSTGFRAKNPRDKEVTGVVCCGLIVKACTIRH